MEEGVALVCPGEWKVGVVGMQHLLQFLARLFRELTRFFREVAVPLNNHGIEFDGRVRLGAQSRAQGVRTDLHDQPGQVVTQYFPQQPELALRREVRLPEHHVVGRLEIIDQGRFCQRDARPPVDPRIAQPLQVKPILIGSGGDLEIHVAARAHDRPGLIKPVQQQQDLRIRVVGMHVRQDALQRRMVGKAVDRQLGAGATDALANVQDMQVAFFGGEITFRLGDDHMRGDEDRGAAALHGHMRTSGRNHHLQGFRMAQVMLER